MLTSRGLGLYSLQADAVIAASGIKRLLHLCPVQRHALTTWRRCPRTTGPSLMPGGSPQAYKIIEPVVTKVAAQVR